MCCSCSSHSVAAGLRAGGSLVSRYHFLSAALLWVFCAQGLWVKVCSENKITDPKVCSSYLIVCLCCLIKKKKKKKDEQQNHEGVNTRVVRFSSCDLEQAQEVDTAGQGHELSVSLQPGAW